jgi:protein subunit release factor A
VVLVTIPSEDLEFVTGCAAAHPMNRGGQHVALACGSVLVIHKPTGIGVRVDGERSQLKCRQVALARLELVLEHLTMRCPEDWP